MPVGEEAGHKLGTARLSEPLKYPLSTDILRKLLALGLSSSLIWYTYARYLNSNGHEVTDRRYLVEVFSK